MKASKPFFSIIISYRYDHDGEEKLIRLLESIDNQSMDDYEILLVHDGKDMNTKLGLDILIEEMNINVIKTIRTKDWGHTQRQIGLSKAKGKYILFTNADNLYYNVFKELKDKIIETGSKEFYTLPVMMVGYLFIKGKLFRTYDNNTMKLSGVPVRLNIDVMCGVASRKAWKSIGGWHDKSEESDWKHYEQLRDKYGFVYCEELTIGEHW